MSGVALATLANPDPAMIRLPFLAPGPAIAALALASSAVAQSERMTDFGRGPTPLASGRGPTLVVDEGDRSGHGHVRPAHVPCISERQRTAIRTTLTSNQKRLAASGLIGLTTPRADLRFRWPLRASGADPGQFGVHGTSYFVDHDQSGPDDLTDYECGTRTYDMVSGYDHRGTDLFTWPFPWTWMDQNRVQVVAVAPGTVIGRMDGNPDENCFFGGGDWNAIYIRHDDGTTVWYGHLKNGSVANKNVGQRVVGGEYLGVVGSSGNSTGPHLHLEVYNKNGQLVDPFGGPCNSLNQRSRWLDQRPYFDSAINRLMVGEAPVEYPACPGRAITHEVSVIPRGSIAYLTTFYRDQLDSQVSMYRLRRPSGTLFESWDHTSDAPHYAASWWWWASIIPVEEEAGVWRFEVEYEGRTYVLEFLVV